MTFTHTKFSSSMLIFTVLDLNLGFETHGISKVWAADECFGWKMWEQKQGSGYSRLVGEMHMENLSSSTFSLLCRKEEPPTDSWVEISDQDLLCGKTADCLEEPLSCLLSLPLCPSMQPVPQWSRSTVCSLNNNSGIYPLLPSFLFPSGIWNTLLSQLLAEASQEGFWFKERREVSIES